MSAYGIAAVLSGRKRERERATKRQPLCDERPTTETCLCCEQHPPRAEFDGESRMWTERIAERPLYCQECFDFIEGDTKP